jgi:hypothetical protein
MNGKSRVYEEYLINIISNKVKFVYGDNLDRMGPKLRDILQKDKVSEEDIRIMIKSLNIEEEILNSIKETFLKEQVELV